MATFPESGDSRAETYVLVLNLDRDTAIPTGRLGCIEFPAGFYTYKGFHP